MKNYTISFMFLVSSFQTVKADAMPAIISYLLSGNTPTVSKLLKTGQTKCYDFDTNDENNCSEEHKGQDGYYQKGVDRSYTTSLPHLKVKDEVTKFIWQDYNISLVSENWKEAIEHCENSTLYGYTDWRLPNMDELKTLVDYGRYKGDSQSSLAAINPIFLYGFNESTPYFWSKTQYVGGIDNQEAWDIDFGYGLGRKHMIQDRVNMVRCVSGDIFSPLAKNSVISNNGIAVDNDTGLMWQDNDDVGIEKNWKEAIVYCKALTLGSYEDWRLPNITELLSITDREIKYNPSLKDGFIKRSSDWFWSSTTQASNANYAWNVRFEDGLETWSFKSYVKSIRCVR